MTINTVPTGDVCTHIYWAAITLECSFLLNTINALHPSQKLISPPVRTRLSVCLVLIILIRCSHLLQQ